MRGNIFIKEKEHLCHVTEIEDQESNEQFIRSFSLKLNSNEKNSGTGLSFKWVNRAIKTRTDGTPR